VLSAFPLIVGPVLLVAAQRHGAAFAAQAAAGTLLGLVALSGFAAAYARCAARRAWGISLAAGWAAAAVLGTLAGRVEVGVVGALAVAGVSLALAHAAIPPGAAARDHELPAWELPVRMACTALLIVALTAAAERFGPTVAGLLSALPTLASVLAVFTHLRHGRDALFGSLRGMLIGMGAFVAFCAVVAVLLDRAGVAATFLLATAAAAVALQAAVVRA
jgi:hypothetical protein